MKLCNYAPDAFYRQSLMPLPQETWSSYLNRLESSEERKANEIHGWIQNYLGGVPELLGREVPRAARVSKSFELITTPSS
jgi:hypothetical protein